MNKNKLPVKHLIIKLVILVTAIAVYLPLPAQYVFNLKQAIAYGMEHSPSARSIRASYNSAEWNYITARSALLPSLNLNGNIPGLSRTFIPVTLPDGSLSFRYQSTAYSTGSLSINQNITPTGGNLFISSGLSRIDQLGNNPTATWSAFPLEFGLSQPLFRVNRLRWDWKQAKQWYEYAQRQSTEAMEDLSITITNAFFNFYIAQKQLANAELNAAINDTLYKVAEGRFSVGKIAENEKLQAELNLMNARNSVDQVRIQSLTAEKRLKNLLGVPETQKIEVIYEETIPIYQVDIDKALLEARENRSDYVSFKIRETDADIDIRTAQAARGFTGDLTVRYGLTNSAPTLDEAYKDMRSSEQLTVGFSLPLVTFGRNKAAYMVAKNNKESITAQNENTRNNLELEIMNNVLQFNQLKQILIISAKSDTIARQRYDISTKRFILGKIDLTNLTIAQNEKDMALINYIENLRNFWVSYYQLRRLTLFDFETGNKIKFNDGIL
ncbi:MAG TPA: TolC family protein [Bacteroidia bacterium]|nr:TolC family protein [Bacteroidia bacterium]